MSCLHLSSGEKRVTPEEIKSITENIRSLRIPAKYPETKDSPILTIGFIGDIQYADRDSNASRDYRGGIRKLEQLLTIFQNSLRKKAFSAFRSTGSTRSSALS